MTHQGIDYGRGLTNINSATGIRYGVIPENYLGDWYEDSEPDYGSPTCPECANYLIDTPANLGEYEFIDTLRDFFCSHCNRTWYSEDSYPDEPLGYTYVGEGIIAHSDSSGEVWITESPFFTYAQFCSPCAPGACYLLSPLDQPREDNRAYCFPSSWFDGEVAPYPVYSVKTGELLPPLTE